MLPARPLRNRLPKADTGKPCYSPSSSLCSSTHTPSSTKLHFFKLKMDHGTADRNLNRPNEWRDRPRARMRALQTGGTATVLKLTGGSAPSPWKRLLAFLQTLA